MQFGIWLQLRVHVTICRYMKSIHIPRHYNLCHRLTVQLRSIMQAEGRDRTDRRSANITSQFATVQYRISHGATLATVKSLIPLNLLCRWCLKSNIIQLLIYISSFQHVIQVDWPRYCASAFYTWLV